MSGPMFLALTFSIGFAIWAVGAVLEAIWFRSKSNDGHN